MERDDIGLGCWSDEARERQRAEVQARQHAKILGDILAMPALGDEVRYRKVLRRDPCAYCGGASEALDHIEPKSSGGEDEWTNRVGVCTRCNSYKGTLPVLLALPWIPIATEYHARRKLLFAK